MITITANIDRVRRALSDLGRRQLPFALAAALTDTAGEVKDAEEVGLETHLDRPTPFTKRGFYLVAARKNRPVASVGIKTKQAGYLGFQISGGSRRPRGRALLVPVGQRRNKYGNIPRGTAARLVARPDTFVASSTDPATRHMRPGIYKRSGAKRNPKPPKLLIGFEPRAQYAPRLPFIPIAERAARGGFQANFMRRLRTAIETAR